MCKTKIETAGTKVAKVEWNQDTNMAVLTYDASKTNGQIQTHCFSWL
jgi:hypothetical protein